MKTNTPTKFFESVTTSNVYRHLAMALCLVLCTLGLGVAANAGGTTTTITTFDAPGAGTGARQGTVAFGINPGGTIAGFFRDTNNARHGFVRTNDGMITVFDDPAAGTCSASCGTIGNGQGTRAFAINPSGEITGFYTDNSGSCHGYVRSPNGTFTQIDAPDAGTGPFPQGTFPSEITPMGINPQGAITGFYVDANSVQHGFVRAPNGKITEFDPTGSIFTNPNAIDAPGAITGFYFDANFVGHGFLRTPNGTITSFDAPGADSTPGTGNGTFGVGVTPTGEIEGVFVDPNGVLHGFVRSTQGTFRTYDIPAAGTGAGQGTLPESNNTQGAITGQYIDGNFVNHGFLRNVQGGFSTFDVPGMGTGAGQGTIPVDNGDSGAIIGEAIDGNTVIHGFLVQGL
ncbi:MAG TPA: hypothetical protein VKE30_10060 [Chthoniobacterales bacterium]|nr:hypothetical protein [Chthoniobacterales bacterium]